MRSDCSAKSGQAIIFLMVVLLIGTIAVVWNINMHRSIVQKMRMRDAGDAAALAGARWQGITLNMLGELNLVQAVLATEAVADGLPFEDENGDLYEDETDALIGVLGPELLSLIELRRRIAICGPLIGFAAGQQMVFNNRVRQEKIWNDFYGDFYISDAENEISQEYIDILISIIDNGIGAGTILAQDGHILLDPGFYAAIESGYIYNQFCPFYINSEYRYYLENYTAPEDFPELPENSGYSILGVEVGYTSNSLSLYIPNHTNSVADLSEFEDAVVDIEPNAEVDAFAHVPLYWIVFGDRWHFSWQEFIDENHLPFRDDVLEQYDYMGPESIFDVRVGHHETFGGAGNLTKRSEENIHVVEEWMPSKRERGQDGERPEKTSRRMRWISAAKTFGYIDKGAGSTPLPPHYFGIVLPTFYDARLIPVQRQVYNADGDPRHNFEHLPRYLDIGISALEPSCSSCQALLHLDDPDFRQRGIEWLSDSANTRNCYRGGGGGGGGGGAPFGH